MATRRIRRHRSSAEFHLGCPYTSQPLCRCRLYERAPPLWTFNRISQSQSTSSDPREAARQELLGAIATGNGAAGYVDGALAHAVHRRANGIENRRDNKARLLAALMDDAEVRRDTAKLNQRLVAAEAAENERVAEVKRLREEARRAAEPPPPPPQPVVPMEEVPAAEDVAKMEELKEIQREQARIRKRERDRERRRQKKREREAERLRKRKR